MDLEKIETFNLLLRELDLNSEVQNGFAITEGEYEQLRIMWNDFPEPTKVKFLESPEGKWFKNFFVIILLYDLNNNIDCLDHVKNLTKQGTVGLSLTISLFNHPVTLKTARKTLVDLLYKGEVLFCEGQLTITDRIKNEAAKRASNQARQRLIRWESLINGYQQRSIWDQLAAVNNFFNQEIIAESDGSSKMYDYWQSPVETLVRGVGDCDDLAVGKYVSLRLLGVPAIQLRIAVLKTHSDGGHAVLFFYPKNTKYPMVLDQIDYAQSGYTKDHILPLALWRSISNMKPIFEINEEREAMPVFVADIPPVFVQVVDNAHSKRPEQRYQDVSEILFDFKNLQIETNVSGWRQTAKFVDKKTRKKSLKKIAIPIVILFPFIAVATVRSFYLSRFNQLTVAKQDSFFRLKNNEFLNWRKLLYLFAKRFKILANRTPEDVSASPKCLIVDDSTIKKIGRRLEFIGKVFDHVIKQHILGFKFLLLGY